MLKEFKQFMADPQAWEMFISGQAGTGKTTSLHDLVEWCQVEEVPYIVCAYTHKACGILKTKLPIDAKVATLHSFLKKRPGINDHATKVEHLNKSTKMGSGEAVQVMLLDEYSMLGEKDYIDIGALQDPEYKGEPAMRVVYIGDPNQLPPVGDIAAIYPSGKYNYTLDKIYRQAGDNKLIETLTDIVGFIQGKPAHPLNEHETFKRGCDLVHTYIHELASEDKVLLAFTNQCVENLNKEIAGRAEPVYEDTLFSPTTRHAYFYLRDEDPEKITAINLAFGDDVLPLGSKYKTLEHLLRIDICKFAYIYDVDEDDEEKLFAYVFGHYQYKTKLEELGQIAVESNAEIEKQTTTKAKMWALNNKHHPLARARAKAWRDYITFKECVICLDFPYAMTIHKSQGSTFENVLIDMNDLSRCIHSNYKMYLKLLYVAISRASKAVYTN